MLIANEKYNTNIAEYILYMYHIEDVIRANQFDMSLLEQSVIAKYNLPTHQLNEIRNWYKNLISQMQREDLVQSGHLSSLVELANDLNDIHIQILNTLEAENYQEQYRWAKEFIKELKMKMNKPLMNEIEVCLDGLYAFMLMKMQGREITEETSQAMAVFSQILRFLSTQHMSKFNNV